MSDIEVYRFSCVKKDSLSESCISKIEDVLTGSDIFTAELVQDFLGLRSTMSDDSHINDVIEYLYTSRSVYVYIFLNFVLCDGGLFFICPAGCL